MNPQIFLYIGLFGSFLILFKAIMSIVDADIDALYGADGVDGVDGDDGIFVLKFLSLSVIAGFFAGFGWVGYAIASGVPNIDTKHTVFVFITSSLAGFLFAAGMSVLFSVPAKLSDPRISDPKEPIGKECEVYMAIPKDGTGKIWVTLNGSTTTVPAKSTGKSFKVHDIVKVIDYSDSGVYTVEAV